MFYRACVLREKPSIYTQRQRHMYSPCMSFQHPQFTNKWQCWWGMQSPRTWSSEDFIPAGCKFIMGQWSLVPRLWLMSSGPAHFSPYEGKVLPSQGEKWARPDYDISVLANLGLTRTEDVTLSFRDCAQAYFSADTNVPGKLEQRWRPSHTGRFAWRIWLSLAVLYCAVHADTLLLLYRETKKACSSESMIGTSLRRYMYLGVIACLLVSRLPKLCRFLYSTVAL